MAVIGLAAQSDSSFLLYSRYRLPIRSTIKPRISKFMIPMPVQIKKCWYPRNWQTAAFSIVVHQVFSASDAMAPVRYFQKMTAAAITIAPSATNATCLATLMSISR
jgi:hypothetical protein